MSKLEALYIHIPFCSSICSYCDFYKMIAKDEKKEKYIHYLVKEMEMKKEYFKDLKTIYIGGGTPTNLPYYLLDYLFFHLHQLIAMSQIEEFTVEANPNDITNELASLLKRYLVNRVSLGVQSFNPDKLQILNRKHTNEDVKRAIVSLKDHGIDNINVDLIYGLEKDNFNIIKKDINLAIKYGSTHISAYSLIIEEKTIYKKMVMDGKIKPIDEDLEASIYQKIQKYLKRKGFIHYEISNFCKKNYQSKHNLVYWNNMNYIGVGANSSYYIDNTRYTNINQLDSYFEGIDKHKLKYLNIDILNKQDQMNEEMMLGLRKIEGINILRFYNKFQIDVYDAFPIIRKLIDLGLLQTKGDFLFIPEDKLFVSNEVLVNFV